MSRGPTLVAVMTMTATVAGCADRSAPPAVPAPGRPWFAEEASARGLDFAYESGHDGGRFLMPEIMGGGAALFDMDGDGDLDAYLVQGGRLGAVAAEPPTNRLYRNDGDGTFTDVTDGSGAADRGYGMGVATGDYDNDGDVDLFVTNVGPDVLLANDGAGVFTDVTAAAGVGDPGWTTSAAFLDYDRDGDLDLFACSYLEWSADLELECFNTMGGPDYCSPRNYLAPAQDRLYRNDDGVFVDVTGESGLASYSGTGLGVVAADFTGDGWVDLFVANDGMRDQLWLNRRGTGFIEISHEAGCAFDQDGRAAAGMGVAAADLDGDADLDLLVGNLRNESDSLFLNEGGRFFSNRTAAMGLAAVSRRFTRFGLGWVDFDHDGRLDLFQACGRVMRQSDLHDADDPYAEPNLLFRGSADGRFVEVSPRGGTATPVVGTSRAAAFGDVDGDGAVDVLVVERDGPVRLLRNVRGDAGHWLSVRAVDEHGRDAIGARVEITAGSRTFTAEVRSAFSYLAASDPRVHVGLGAADTVDSITVRWPDGEIEHFEGGAADRSQEVRRGEGAADRVN